MSSYVGPLGVASKKRSYTSVDIFQRFKYYIEGQKPGLKRFYKLDESDQYFKDAVTRGLAMTHQLMDNDCPQEVAMSLSLLALWDLVVLVDNSISMGIDEGGSRVKTLSDTLRAASTVYSFAERRGITAVRFMNSSNKYSNVTPKKISALMKKVVFEGLTNIGTKLRDRVLVNHVTPDMKKPLLVVVITDAEIEGEATGLLRDIIMSQAVELKEKYGNHGPDAVAYQFAKIGNDEVGQNLVVALDDDKSLGKYIDSMGDHHKLEDLVGNMWKILPKLLLGAISPYWDEESNPDENVRERDEELEQESLDDDDDDLDEESDEEDGDILMRGKTDSGGGDKKVSNDKISASNISMSNNKAKFAPSPHGQANITPPESPVEERIESGLSSLTI